MTLAGKIHLANLLLLFLALSNAADVLFTQSALELGVEEANPIARLAIEQTGIIGLAAIKALLLLFLLVTRKTLAANGGLVGLLAVASSIYISLSFYHLASYPF